MQTKVLIIMIQHPLREMEAVNRAGSEAEGLATTPRAQHFCRFQVFRNDVPCHAHALGHFSQLIRGPNI